MKIRTHLERWFAAGWGERDERVIDELMAEDCSNHGLEGANGREGFRAFFRVFCGAFPRVRITVNDCLEDGDRFAAACTAAVTDSAGRTHTIDGTVFGRFDGRQFTETRNTWDFLKLVESTKTIEAGAMGKLIEAETPASRRATATAPAMSHREYFERWFSELWGTRNAEIIDECVAEDCKIVGLPDTTDGRAAFHAFFDAFGAAFPEVHITVDDCVEQGEAFAFRCSGYVVDRQGKEHPFTGGSTGKVRDGKIVEAWNQWDFLTLLESVGAVKKDVLSSTIQSEIAKAR